MIKKYKNNGVTSTVPLGISVGVLISMFIVLIGSAVIAWMLKSEWIQETGIRYCSPSLHTFASFVGALAAVKRIQRLRIQTCMLHGAILYVLLLSITALFFDGEYGSLGITAIAILTGSLLVAFIGAIGKQGTGIRRRKTAYR